MRMSPTTRQSPPRSRLVGGLVLSAVGVLAALMLAPAALASSSVTGVASAATVAPMQAVTLPAHLRPATTDGHPAAVPVGSTPATTAKPAGTVTPNTCPDNAWSNRDGSHFGSFAGTDVRIRNGPGTRSACGAFGQGEPGDRVQFHCWKVGEDGFTWSHLIDASRRGANGQFLQGWSRDDLLTGNGAFNHC
jgi:hypothetical protein